MKKLNIFLITGLLLFIAPSCKKFFDINQNPNRPTSGIAEEVILPKTIVEWANFMPAASAYGEEVVGYTTNAGGVSGWGSFVSYVFTPGSWNNMWTVPYDNLTDINPAYDDVELGLSNNGRTLTYALVNYKDTATTVACSFSNSQLDVNNNAGKYDQEVVVTVTADDLFDNALYYDKQQLKITKYGNLKVNIKDDD
ncbi:MAG: hypothetical protein ACK5NK_02760, partial [Niabella sp.]